MFKNKTSENFGKNKGESWVLALYWQQFSSELVSRSANVDYLHLDTRQVLMTKIT